MFTVGLIAVLTAIAVPQILVNVEASRAFGAARFMSSRLMLARMMAVQRTASVALRFDVDDRGYRVAMFQDGNRNGVRTRDIDLGIDRQVEQPIRLFELFPGVDFGLLIDDVMVNPIQLGGTTLMSFTPAGTATSGSVYIRGRDGAQYAVRVLGATGRTRVLRYDDRLQRWSESF